MRGVATAVLALVACSCGSVSGKATPEAPADGAVPIEGGAGTRLTDGGVDTGRGAGGNAGSSPEGGSAGSSSLGGDGIGGAGGTPVQPNVDGGVGGAPAQNTGGVRLRGGIVTMGPAPAAAGSIRLVRQNISISSASVCKDNVCLHSGGIKP